MDMNEYEKNILRYCISVDQKETASEIYDTKNSLPCTILRTA